MILAFTHKFAQVLVDPARRTGPGGCRQHGHRSRRDETTQVGSLIYQDILAAELLTHVGIRERIEILTNAAEIFGRTGDREVALSCAREALALAERGRQALVEKVRRVLRGLEEG